MKCLIEIKNHENLEKHKDSDDWRIRQAVAYEGFYLEELCNDINENVSQIANSKLEIVESEENGDIEFEYDNYIPKNEF